MNVSELLIGVLEREGAATVRALVDAVRAAGGHGVSRAAIERTLESDSRFVRDDDSSKPRWRLDPTVTATATESGEHADTGDIDPAARRAATRSSVDGLELRPWQVRALAAWSPTCRGVVEAVTGTGKTRLALAAVRSVIDAGGRALVLVPTLELQDQWVREVRSLLPDVGVGRLGGGSDDDLFAVQVLVATPHSAAAVPVDLPPRIVGLLVADEAHRYGAPSWGAALGDGFALRLALTATYERGDDGVEEVLAPYFGDVLYRYGYAEAAADGTIAPFRIALAGIRLTPGEAAAHAAADTRVKQLYRELIGPLGMPREPQALFAAVAAVVADADRGGGDGPRVRASREYLARVRERRDIAATASGKLAVCRSAAAALPTSRSLIFTDTVDQAQAATATLRGAQVAAELVHGGIPAERRRIRLAQFRQGRIDALVAPRVLDEGVDVPDADVAIVLAAFRSRRHLVQRLGRVLRRTADDREARLVLAYARGTAEDPANGGHAAFLDEVRGVARSIDDVDIDGEPHALGRWLSEGTSPGDSGYAPFG